MSSEAQAPAGPQKPATAAAAGAAGSPGDALTPFADALLAAAKTAGAEPAGDPSVCTSLELGWLMNDILAGRARPPFPAGLALPPATGYKAQARQLGGLLDPLKLEGVDPKDVVDALASGASAKVQAAAWQPDLAAALLGADVRFAKAYGLGRQLNAFGYDGLPPSQEPRLAEMSTALDDLSTALPPHAARGVSISIQRWAQLPSTADQTNLLKSQCELWRTVLVGEKKATELLEPENYLDAADRLAAKLAATAVDALNRLGWLVAVIGLLIVAAVATFIVFPKTAGSTAAGVSGILAAVGLTWKGIGGTVGKLAGKLEAPLWGAEVDGALADAITLPDTPPDTTSVRQRRKAIADGDYAERATRARAARTPAAALPAAPTPAAARSPAAASARPPAQS